MDWIYLAQDMEVRTTLKHYIQISCFDELTSLNIQLSMADTVLCERDVVLFVR
jgi:hypothetical protein